MAASPQLDEVIGTIRTWVANAQSRGTIEGLRVAYEELASSFPLAADIKTERVAIGQVAAEWIAAPGVADDRVLLFLRGGGYIMGSMGTHREVISRLSRAAGVRALGLDYRLAPENPFPAALEDAVAAYRWLLSSEVSPNKIVIVGDSSGGGLTVATLVALRYLGEPLPAAGVCISAWTDLTQTAESLTTKAGVDPFLQREVLELIAQGHNNQVIAQRLVLSPKTVRNHVSNVFSKLQVADRAEAIVRAREAGMGGERHQS